MAEQKTRKRSRAQQLRLDVKRGLFEKERISVNIIAMSDGTVRAELVAHRIVPWQVRSWIIRQYTAAEIGILGRHAFFQECLWNAASSEEAHDLLCERCSGNSTSDGAGSHQV